MYREESKSVPVNKKLDRLVRLAIIMSLATDRNYELRDRLEGKKAMVKFRRLALSQRAATISLNMHECVCLVRRTKKVAKVDCRLTGRYFPLKVDINSSKS